VYNFNSIFINNEFCFSRKIANLCNNFQNQVQQMERVHANEKTQLMKSFEQQKGQSITMEREV
jgi:hypothetical protein